MTTLKSIWAVLAGLLVNVVLSVATDTILEQTGVFPNFGDGIYERWMLVIALGYRLVYTVMGGYVTAGPGPSHATC